jgi:ubiquinone/menaquinone biosynthesis C-methylase UbiE
LSAIDHFTGERYLPGVPGEIAYEHCHRYAFARRFVAGRRVLDAACGEGYGAALLAGAAASVVGVDIAPQVVADARVRYAQIPNLRFTAASVTALPLADASVDAVVSFETIEHVGADDQRRMLEEFARVLAPDGVLILSSPNRPEYSEARGYANPFHVHELDRDELAARLAPHFRVTDWYRQRRYLGSAIWREAGGDAHEAMSGSPSAIGDARAPAAMYYLVIAAREASALGAAPALSLYADADDAEWAHIERDAREVLRLDALLRERDEQLHAQAADAQELRAMVEYRDGVVAERDRRIGELRDRQAEADDALAQAAAERDRLNRQIDAQERLIAYRESVRWWCELPLLRARRVWQRVRSSA